jgi:hypothetical protein
VVVLKPQHCVHSAAAAINLLFVLYPETQTLKPKTPSLLITDPREECAAGRITAVLVAIQLEAALYATL